MRVDLMMFEDDTAGMIVLCPEGATWINQTGGIACNHPSAVGVYVPLGNIDYQGDSLCDHYNLSSNDTRIAAWLGEVLGSDFEADPSQEGCAFGEAWVPARVVANPGDDYLQQFAGRSVIVTYSNSD